MAVVVFSIHVAQADPPAVAAPRDVPNVYILKPGALTHPNRFEPRLKFYIDIGNDSADITVLCTEQNGLGHQHTTVWRTTGPDLKAGMVLPLFGVVGRLHNEGEDLAFETIPEADLPPGVEYTGTAFPMYLGVRHEGLKLANIGTDDSGKPFAEIVWIRKDQPKVSFPRLFVGSIWTIESQETITRLRVAQIVLPDEQQQIVGWITLRPEGTGVEPRRQVPVQFEIPESITIPRGAFGDRFKARELTPSVDFLGWQRPPEDAGQHMLEVYCATGWDGTISRTEQGSTIYPTCEVGMVLPLYGGVGRVESIENDEIKFKMLPRTEYPAGITGAPNDYPLILDTPTGDLSVERIGIDADGVLSANLVHWTPKFTREKIAPLKLNSTFVLRDDDTVTEYRVTELVRPSAKRHVVGWIKLRPIEGGILERKSIE